MQVNNEASKMEEFLVARNMMMYDENTQAIASSINKFNKANK